MTHLPATVDSGHARGRIATLMGLDPGCCRQSSPHLVPQMNRLAVVAAVFLVAGCAKKEPAPADSTAVPAMAPAPADSNAQSDSATKTDSAMKKDSGRQK